MSTQRRIPICLVLAVVVALACAAPSLANGPGVRAWLTTGDQSSLLAEQPPTAFGAPDPAAPTRTTRQGSGMVSSIDTGR